MTALTEDFSRGWRMQRGAQALSMPKHALSQLDVSVRQALARLVDKFQKAHPEHKLCSAVVTELGFGAAPPRPTSAAAGMSASGANSVFQRATWSPSPAEVVPDELRARFGDLLAGLGTLGLTSNAWGMARDRMAIRGSVREMSSRLRSALGTSVVGGTEIQRLRELLYKAEDLQEDLG